AGGTIINCYAKGGVSGNYCIVGGLVGQNYAGTIKNCYSVGHVQGPSEPVFLPLDVGGLIGNESDNGTVITSFWDTQTSGQATSAGGLPNTGGIPLQTNEMQTATIFLIVGWDFVDENLNGTEDIWWILEGQDYPRLWWEAHD
ncbi:MAG: GLUG motif-containing protein, partial [Planctomycetota bacterium]